MDISWIVVGFVLIITGVLMIFYKRPSNRRKYPRGAVILHQIGRGPAAPSLSPFPLKLETYMRMTKIPYLNDHQGGMSRKGKSPWITYNDEDVADSQIAIDYLNSKFKIDLNKRFSSEEKAVAQAFLRLAEDNLYWTMCAFTFGEDDTSLYEIMPYTGVKKMIVWILRHRIKGQLWSQGMGRHSKAETDNMAFNNLKALSDFLGVKNFLLGHYPCEEDCAIFGMLAQILYHMPGSPHLQYITEYFPNLRDYCERMKVRYWPDWNKCITHWHTVTATN